jgi:hypothetical protein
MFHLCQPVLVMLQLDWEELHRLQQFLPRLQPQQLLQLLQLLHLGVYETLQMRECLLSKHRANADPHAHTGYCLRLQYFALTDLLFSGPITLTVVEQPPERQVYACLLFCFASGLWYVLLTCL